MEGIIPGGGMSLAGSLHGRFTADIFDGQETDLAGGELELSQFEDFGGKPEALGSDGSVVVDFSGGGSHDDQDSPVQFAEFSSDFRPWFGGEAEVGSSEYGMDRGNFGAVLDAEY